MSRAQVERVRAMLAARPANATLAERRAGFERMAASLPCPDDLSAEPWEAGGLSGVWYAAAGAAKDRVTLWLHGGQFVLGSPGAYASFAARLSAASGASVLCVGYRLAPEHPFPAALEDATAALEALLAAGHRPAVGGDSAGANLAVGALQAVGAAARDRVAAAYLLSGYFDMTHTGASIPTRAPLDPFVDPAAMDAVAQAYLAGAEPGDPRASPLFGSVEGFPPTLIQVGAHEALFDDSRRFARRLEDAGAPVVFQEWVDMIHIFPFFADAIDEGAWALAQAGAFLHRHLFQA
jgi:acetyl esterase/lipase